MENLLKIWANADRGSNLRPISKPTTTKTTTTTTTKTTTTKIKTTTERFITTTSQEISRPSTKIFTTKTSRTVLKSEADENFSSQMTVSETTMKSPTTKSLIKT